MTSEPEVEVEDSPEDLARRVAGDAATVLAAAVAARGTAHLVITGGSILEKVLAELASSVTSWDGVHVWWGDERYVPADSDDRNDRPALAALFDKVDIDPGRLHRMPASDSGFADAETAATAYADSLAAAALDGEPVPQFDLILLGLGPDGHCASLFPGHPGTRVVDRPVIAVHDSPKPPPDRLSLTFPALDAARQIWLIASGDGKADAVARAVAGADRTEVPSAGPRGREHTLWLVDRAAAAKLAP